MAFFSSGSSWGNRRRETRLNPTAERRQRSALLHNRGLRGLRGDLPRETLQRSRAGPGVALQERHQVGLVVAQVFGD